MADGSSSFPQWKGLFDWSMKFHDGTHQTNFTQMDADKQQWLGQVMEYYTQDFGKRMNVISEGLSNVDDSEAAIQHKEELLEELIDICESIDFARDLGKVGGLQCAIALMYCKHESLKWRAAELLAVCSQNNMPVQKEFLAAGVLEAAYSLLNETSAIMKVKALLLVSAMVRGFDEASQRAVRDRIHMKLADFASSQTEDTRVLRKSLQLLCYFCSASPGVQPDLVVTSSICKHLPGLFSNEDADTARWAIELSISIAAEPAGLEQLKDAGALLSASNLVVALSTKAADELEASRDELEAAKRLQQLLA